MNIIVNREELEIAAPDRADRTAFLQAAICAAIDRLTVFKLLPGDERKRTPVTAPKTPRSTRENKCPLGGYVSFVRNVFASPLYWRSKNLLREQPFKSEEDCN